MQNSIQKRQAQRGWKTEGLTCAAGEAVQQRKHRDARDSGHPEHGEQKHAARKRAGDDNVEDPEAVDQGASHDASHERREAENRELSRCLSCQPCHLREFKQL